MGKKRKENTEKKENDSNQKNEAYFKSFIRTRGGLHVLHISPAGIFIALVCLSITWRNSPYEYNIDPLKSKINWILIGICIMLAITFFLVLSQRAMQVLVKHQGLLGIWECCVSVIYTFILTLLCYILSQLKKGSGIQYGSLFSLIVIFLFISVYIGSLVYNWFWLKRQLDEGFSEQRTMANYFPKAKALSGYESTILIIVFVVVPIISIFIGLYYQFLGMFCGLFFAAIFSRLNIELGYSAYLLNKSKDYWITYRFEEKAPWQEQLKARFKKMSTYVVLSVVLFFLFLYIVSEVTISQMVRVILSYAITGLLIWFVVVFIIWIIKKLKSKF